MGSNPKLLKNKIKSKFNKDVTLKDLANIRSSCSKNLKNSLDEIVSILINIYKANVELFHDDANNFKGLFFQTDIMKQSMASWPDIVFIDGTYKLCSSELTLFLMVVEDGNGVTEVVSVFIIATEDYLTFKWMFEIFKRENEEACKKIQCFMGDKDLLERDVIKEIFPGTPVYICLFHTLKTFKRTITTEKFNISIEDRNNCLELLNQLAYSLSEEKYEEIYTCFKETAPADVIKYFDKNWHCIKKERTVFNMNKGNLLNRTNNRLEALNKDIKMVVKKNSSLTAFVNSLMNWLECNMQERNNRVSQMILKKSISNFDSDSTEYQYQNLLTNYSFKYVLKQLKLSSSVNISCVNGEYKVNSASGEIKVELYNCSCAEFSSLMLPCRHIFSLRKYINKDLYEEVLCAPRWHKKIYISEHRAVCNNDPTDLILGCTSSMKTKNPTMTEKRKIANTLTNSLMNLMCLSTNSHFTYKIENLEKIINIWKQGKEITVGEINIDLVDDKGTENDDQAVSEIKICNFPEKVPENNNMDINISDHIENTVVCVPDSDLLNNITTLSENNVCTEKDITADIHAKNLNIVSNIKLPTKTIRKGRPKGSDLTVIGSKKTRAKKIPEIFKLKTDKEKVDQILHLLVNDDCVISQCLQSEYIIMSDLHTNFTQSFYDDQIDLNLIKEYVEGDGFDNLTQLKLRKDMEWICNVCDEILGDKKSIICENCLLWYHFKCVGIKNVPNKKNWIRSFH